MALTGGKLTDGQVKVEEVNEAERVRETLSDEDKGE